MYACPKCNGETDVRDTRELANHPGIRRFRKCRGCGEEIYTYEFTWDKIEDLVTRGIGSLTPWTQRQILNFLGGRRKQRRIPKK